MRLNLLEKIKLVGTISAMAVLVIIGIAKMPDHAIASSSQNVHGWLWSDAPNGSDHHMVPTNIFGGQGLGWISMNDTEGCQGQSCSTYGVNLDTATGELSGYAWSEYGEWLNFDATGPYPTGVGTAAVAARVSPSCIISNQTTCPVVGWAKFTASQKPQAGGWDGWVSLGGKTANGTQTYGVTYDKAAHKMTGKAWGDMVAGWVDFTNVTVTVAVTDVCPDDAAYPATLGSQTTLPAGYHFEQVITYPHGGSPLQQQGQLGNYTIQTMCIPNTTPDVCSNVTGIQSTTPIQVSGTWYEDPDNDQICTPMVNPPEDPQDVNLDLCPDNLNPNLPGTQSSLPYFNSADNTWYDDPNHDGRCTKTSDLCPFVTGNQSPNGTNTWQVGNTWYGMAAGVCIKDVCPDKSGDSNTTGFQAVLPQNYVLSGGFCVPASGGGNGTGVPVSPIYKEN